jgi:hypothetical protein
MALEELPAALSLTLDGFVVSLDDPWNLSGQDRELGVCVCKFISPTKIECRVSSHEGSTRLERDLSSLTGCRLEDSGDAPSAEGHCFELTGYSEAGRFELRVWSEHYELHLCESDQRRLEAAGKPQQPNP